MNDTQKMIVAVLLLAAFAVGFLGGEQVGFFRGAHAERVKAVQAGVGR